jgi:hypothetical protein
MGSSLKTRTSRRILVPALVGVLGALAATSAQAASGMPLGSFETYKPVPFVGSAPWGIAAGPNGAMWFAEQGTSRLSKVGTGNGRLVTTSVNGRSTAGSRLSCANANSSPWKVASTARVWRRDGMPIPDATRRTYRLRVRDIGALITCQASVTFSSTLVQLGVKARPIKGS